MTQLPKAIVAGHLCLDIIPGMQNVSGNDFFRLFQPGRLIEVETASISTGGAASNTGLAMNKLGIATKIVAKIGDDLFGSMVKNVLNQFNDSIGDSLIFDETYGTSYTVIINPPGIDRIFLHSPGANDSFTGEDIDYRVISEASLFHFGYPQLMRKMYIDGGDNLEWIYRQAQAAGLVTSLDVTFPDPSTIMGKVDWKAILTKTLPFVDIFCPSIEEILYMVFPDLYADMVKKKGGILENLTPEILTLVSNELLGLGVNLLLIKLGEKGLYLSTRDQFSGESKLKKVLGNSSEWLSMTVWSPCFEVEVIGTTGAGDATIAGFLTALLRGYGPNECVNFAAAVGACNVEQADALSGVKGWDATVERIAAGWPKKSHADWELTGWQYEKSLGIWCRG